MALGNLVEDSSTVVKETWDDALSDAPTGYTFVSAATFAAAYTGEILQGGTWVVTGGVGVYTPPAEYTEAFDPTIGAGVVKKAAHDMLDVFDEGLAHIEDNRLIWAQDVVNAAIDGIRWQIINTARIALNAVRTASFRQKFCEESASWPTGVNGNAREYVDAFAALSTLYVPSKDFSWVSHGDASPARATIENSADVFMNATNVENEPVSAKLAGREWINDIPA